MNNAITKLKNAYNYFKINNKSFKSKIPTIFTCLRLTSVITVAPLILTGNVIPGLILAGLLATTDFFDGALARKLNAESEFGCLLDPIVDKIFAVTMIICGASINPILLINIVPEVAIAINNAKAFNENKNVNSSIIGKLKTWVLSINVLVNLIPGLDISIKSLSVYFTFAFQSLTYIKYKEKNSSSMIINRTYTDENLGTDEQVEEIKTKPSIKEQEIELLKYKKELIENSRIQEKQKVLKKTKN